MGNEEMSIDHFNKGDKITENDMQDVRQDEGVLKVREFSNQFYFKNFNNRIIKIYPTTETEF